MKIATIIGARPQFVKAAAFSRIVAGRADMEEILIHTGQHYDFNMSEVFFQQLNIPPPRYNLGVGSGHHGAQTGKMLEMIEAAFQKEKPNVVLVYGDTNSTLAGALAAAKLHIPVAHVEAGLRSFNRRMPEEINRVLVDALSSALFAPSDLAVANLRREGVVEGVRQVGDVMADANRRLAPLARERSTALADTGLEPGHYVVLTLHR